MFDDLFMVMGRDGRAMARVVEQSSVKTVVLASGLMSSCLMTSS